MVNGSSKKSGEWIIKKICEAILILDILFLVLGFLLSVNVVPIQNLNLLSNVEKRRLLEEYAINYPLGLLLLKIGIVLLIPLLLFYVYSFIRSKWIKQRNY
ncbi:hypothetical protein P7E02_21550 [Enterococcus hulanensis]|uniref:hypothetical protein n=1 Tax=Enterococcus hulanensis TaxID=2559929 RepID=UPI00288E48D5|nr:hypothetical protein [Enterococcus hulanensis]MDT2662483.1 hypothetical protein [Enterococcus hulanensis]